MQEEFYNLIENANLYLKPKIVSIYQRVFEENLTMFYHNSLLFF